MAICDWFTIDYVRQLSGLANLTDLTQLSAGKHFVNIQQELDGFLRLSNTQEVADADAKIAELVEKHIEEEEVRYTEMEKQLKFYEKEFNINPLSWGRKKKRK